MIAAETDALPYAHRFALARLITWCLAAPWRISTDGALAIGVARGELLGLPPPTAKLLAKTNATRTKLWAFMNGPVTAEEDWI